VLLISNPRCRRCRCLLLLVPADKLAELPHLVDPALTAKGIAQARALQHTASAMQPVPELIVVSPMRRAVDTALLAFAHIFGDDGAAQAAPLGRSDLQPTIPIIGM
jgi:broad specificity phosphatase PhoE